MKAVIYKKYGGPDVLKLTEVEKPSPKDNEVLIKIYATTVTSGDTRLRSSDFPPLFWLPARLIFGFFKPKKKVLGHEWAGIVEAKGKDITKFEVGDALFGTTTLLPTGSYAEYICIPEEWKHGVIGKKPGSLRFQEAAALPVGAMTAMFLLEKAKLGQGQAVLVYGASGSVGSYAIQLAKNKGAHVTAVCSGRNFDMVKSLGADSVIDYQTQDYSTLGDEFDIVFDAVGKTSKAQAKKVLKRGASYVSVNMLTKEKGEHLEKIRELAEKGALRPFIDKTFKLEEITMAHEYVDSGRKRGNVVIEIEQQSN